LEEKGFKFQNLTALLFSRRGDRRYGGKVLTKSNFDGVVEG
jgi:hypothetical protein